MSLTLFLHCVASLLSNVFVAVADLDSWYLNPIGEHGMLKPPSASNGTNGTNGVNGASVTNDIANGH